MECVCLGKGDIRDLIAQHTATQLWQSIDALLHALVFQIREPNGGIIACQWMFSSRNVWILTGTSKANNENLDCMGFAARICSFLFSDYFVSEKRIIFAPGYEIHSFCSGTFERHRSVAGFQKYKQPCAYPSCFGRRRHGTYSQSLGL